MQALAPLRPRFVASSSRPCLHLFSLRALSSSSSSDYKDKSRVHLPRFFCDVLPHHKGCIVRVEGDEFWHITKVLRLKTNDRVELFDGKGGVIEGSIQRINRTGLDFLASEDRRLVLPQSPEWHVFAAFRSLKGGRADWLVEKCTELGASSVTPLLTERSPFISENRLDRFQRVILAATKQSQRLHEMKMNPPVKVEGLLHHILQTELSFVATAGATPLLSAVKSLKMQSSGLIIVGPEGDFTEKEVAVMLEARATAVGLGPHRLRVETATMTLLATLMLWCDSEKTPRLLTL